MTEVKIKKNANNQIHIMVYKIKKQKIEETIEINIPEKKKKIKEIEKLRVHKKEYESESESEMSIIEEYRENKENNIMKLLLLRNNKYKKN